MNEVYDNVSSLEDLLAREIDARRRAQCTARVQSDAVQLALDLLVREPDINGFFRVFVKTLVDECDSYASGVWLLNDDKQSCELWMAYLGDRFFSKASEDWQTLALPRESMAAHLMAYTPGWTETIDYASDDPRLPDAIRAFNHERDVESLVVAPLVLPTRSLGWVVRWRRATRRRAGIFGASPSSKPWPPGTLALHQSRLAEQTRLKERRQAVEGAIGSRATSTTRSPGIRRHPDSRPRSAAAASRRRTSRAQREPPWISRDAHDRSPAARCRRRPQPAAVEDRRRACNAW